MLRKLLKHEYKATGRFFLPVYGIFAALLVIERLSMLATQRLAGQEGPVGQLASILMVIFTIITVLGILAMVVSPLIYAISRFYRNMLGDEGYLSFTLPVTTSQHIWSKLLVAASWQILTVLVMCLYGFLFALTMDAGEVWAFFHGIGRVFMEAMQAVGAWAIVLPVLAVVAILTQMCGELLTLYSAMSIGQTSNKHKFLNSAGIYILIKFVTAFILQFLAAALMAARMGWWFDATDAAISASIGLQWTNGEACRFVLVVLLVGIAINGLLGMLHFFLSRYFLTKRLNLA